MDREKLMAMAAMLKDGFVAGAKDFGADAANLAKGNLVGPSFEHRRAVMPTTFGDRFSAAPQADPNSFVGRAGELAGGLSPDLRPVPMPTVAPDPNFKSNMPMVSPDPNFRSSMPLVGADQMGGAQVGPGELEKINEILKRMGSAVPQNSSPGSVPYGFGQ